MSHEQLQQRPLNILTIDGGGYQGISNLLILGDLMREIAKQMGASKPPRPCDVFDVICGAGSGGWIALLLGRLMLSVAECHYEYCNIAEAMARPNTTASKCSRHVHHSIYDIKRVEAYVNHLTEKYGTGAGLLATERDVRCKQALVVARYRTEKGQVPYLFRSYSVGDLEPMASISDAFCAAGAKKGFLYPYKLKLGDGPTMRFGNETFANCFTNATSIALDEVIRIYGAEARISAVVNIAPGVPHEADLRRMHSLSRRLSWESTSSTSSNGSNASKTSNDSKVSKGPGGSTEPFWKKLDCFCPISDSDGEETTSLKRHVSPERGSHIGRHRHRRICGFIGCKKADLSEIRQQLKARRTSHRNMISARIKTIDSNAVYQPLGPEDAPKDIVINDVLGLAPNEAQRTAMEYLGDPGVKVSIGELAKICAGMEVQHGQLATIPA